MPAGQDDRIVGASEAFFLDGFSPCVIGDMLFGVVKGCEAEDMAKGWSPACRGFACSMDLTEMASAAFTGVVENVRRGKEGVTLVLRARREAHRRQIMINVRTGMQLVRVSIIPKLAIFPHSDIGETLPFCLVSHR